MDTRLLKRLRRKAKSMIRVVAFSDGIAIHSGEYKWHWDDNSKCGYSWKHRRNVYFEATFRCKEELVWNYNNAVRALIIELAHRERIRRNEEKALKAVKAL